MQTLGGAGALTAADEPGELTGRLASAIEWRAARVEAGLAIFGGVDAGEPHMHRITQVQHFDRVTVENPLDLAGNAGAARQVRSGACGTGQARENPNHENGWKLMVHRDLAV